MQKDNWEPDFERIRDFVARWHGLSPLSPTSLATSSLPDIPLVLKLFYQLCGSSLRIVVGYNNFVSDDKLLTTSLPVEICNESQGLYRWAIEDISENPRVLGRPNVAEAAWQAEGDHLCRFLLALCFHDATICAPFGASVSWCSSATAQRILSGWSEFNLAPWRWPASPTRFFGAKDALAVLTPNENGLTFICGAKRASDLDHVRPFIDKSWEYVRL